MNRNQTIKLLLNQWKTLTSEGVPPLTLAKCKNTNMLGYKVYGNSVQQSKNLLDIQTAPRNGIVRATITNSGNGVKVTATAANNSCDFWTTITSLTTGEEYTISFTTERSGTTGGGIRLYVGNSMKVNNLNLSAGNYSFTFTAGESVSIYFYGASNNNVVGDYAIFTNVQLEKGSSATSYVSPYPTPAYPQEIESVGDKTINLLDLFGRTEGSAGGSAATNTRNFDYTKYYLGFSGNNYYYSSYISNLSFANKEITFTSNNANYGVSFPVKVEPNTTYTISGETFKISGNNYNFAIGYYDVNGDYLSFDRRSLTFTTPNNCVTANIILLAEESNVSYTHKNIQLELGNTSHNYEPYNKYKIPIKITDSNDNTTTTNIYLDEPLRKIGNYADYIDLETQKVYRRITKKIFDGTENIGYSSSAFSYAFGQDMDDISGIVAVISNYYKAYSWDALFLLTASGTCGIARSKNSLRIREVDVQNFNGDTSLFKAWLTQMYNNNVPLIAYYVLATKTEENITLPDILLNKGTNIIEVDTTTTPSNMWIKYKGK